MYMLKDKGISSVVVGHDYDVNELIIYVIKKNKDRIKGSVKSNAPASAVISCPSCNNPFLKKTDKALYAWLEGGDGGCQGTIQGDV
jgi:hypothetical protein